MSAFDVIVLGAGPAGEVVAGRLADRLDGERRVRVGDALHEARAAIVIAVGSWAAMPSIPGLAEARPWTSRDATTTDMIPARVIVLGGGVVGVEMAEACSDLGSKVTVIEAAPRVLARDEAFAGEQIHKALLERGVDVRVGAEAQAVRREGGTVTLELGDGPSVEGDEVLVVVGRRPRTGDLGLETVGLAPGEEIEVDDTMRVRAYDVPSSVTAGASFHGRNTPGTSRLVVDEDRA